MPKISDEMLHSVFFLYARREDAQARRNPGGTGFIVVTGTKIPFEKGTHFYGVSNWHVAVQKGFSVIRLADNLGGEILEFDPSEWEFIPGGPDVAVVPLSFPGRWKYGANRVPSVSTADFAPSPERFSSYRHSDQYGVGDDVFMLGLFIDHSGHTTNVPSARFGNISMMPSEEAAIKQPTEYRGQSFVLDMHSRTGFSGSPVFVYRTFGSDLTTDRHRIERIKIDTHSDSVRGNRAEIEFRTLFAFLGIHWGQFPERWELRQGEEIAEARRDHLITDGSYIEGMSGMTCVIPSWEISRLLDLPKFQKMREEEAEKEEADKRLRSGPRSEVGNA